MYLFPYSHFYFTSPINYLTGNFFIKIYSHTKIPTDLRHWPPSPEVAPEPPLLPLSRLLVLLASLLALLLVFTLRLASWLPPVVPALLVVVGPAVGGILGTLHRLPVRTCHVRSLWHVL